MITFKNRALETPLPSLCHEDLVGLFHIYRELTPHRLDIFQEPKHHYETAKHITYFSSDVNQKLWKNLFYNINLRQNLSPCNPTAWRSIN